MAKPVEPRKMGVEARPWEEGKRVSGIFKRREVFEGVESAKLTFDATGSGDEEAVWETKALMRFDLNPGTCYVVVCNGKRKFKNGSGWDFTVTELDQKDEIVKELGDNLARLAKDRMADTANPL